MLSHSTTPEKSLKFSTDPQNSDYRRTDGCRLAQDFLSGSTYWIVLYFWESLLLRLHVMARSRHTIRMVRWNWPTIPVVCGSLRVIYSRMYRTLDENTWEARSVAHLLLPWFPSFCRLWWLFWVRQWMISFWKGIETWYLSHAIEEQAHPKSANRKAIRRVFRSTW